MKAQPDNERTVEVISTGHPEIDRKLGGGIPQGSLTLIEGQSDAGKSVLSQQMIWGSMQAGHRVALVSTENTVRSFNNQMRSLGLDIIDYLLLGRLKVYHVESARVRRGSGRLSHTGHRSQRPRVRVEVFRPVQETLRQG